MEKSQMDRAGMATSMLSTGGAEALQAAQRGFAAFGAAQELMVKAMLRAATRQAELARETMSDCLSATAAMRLPSGAQDGQEPMRRAGLAAETWLRTWQSITDDFRHDMVEATDVLFAGTPSASASPGHTNGAAGAKARPAH